MIKRLLLTILCGSLLTMAQAAQGVESGMRLPQMPKILSDVVSDEHVTITFPFDQGTEGQTAVFGPADNADSYFKTSYSTHGDGLIITGVSMSQTQFQPVVSNEGSANDGNAVDFLFIPKNGLRFTPVKVSFVTTRFGTDGGKVDASWVGSDGQATSLAKAIIPARNNATPNKTEWSQELSGISASDGLCGLRLNLYSLGNTKQVGFGNIVIEGIVEGTIQDVTQCRLFVQVPEEAGKVKHGPVLMEMWCPRTIPIRSPLRPIRS